MVKGLGITAPPIDRGTQYKAGDEIPIARIRTDGGTQARAALDANTVLEYTQAMQDGAQFPLIVVYHDGTNHWLADGFHRVAAARNAGQETVRAEVRPGQRRDAVLYACGANNAHGLRRSRADKRRAIETLLRDDEWKQWSDSEIARRCQVSHPTVATVRAELYPENLQDSRTVERAGTTYQMTPAVQPRLSEEEYQLADQARTLLRGPIDPQVIADARKRVQRIRGGALRTTLIAEIDHAEHAMQVQPNIPEVAPITVQTTDGTRETTPQRVLGGLALHPSVADPRVLLITHIASGRAVAQFTQPLSASGAFVQLAALDWSGVTDGHTGPDLRRQINAIVVQYPDVNRLEERTAQLREEAPIEPARADAPAHTEPPTPDERSSAWHKRQQSIDDTALGAARISIERGNYQAAEMLLRQVQVKTLARDELQAQIPVAYAQPPIDPRMQAQALLRQLAPLIVQITADDQEGLSEAIDALYHAKAGSEATGWLRVGWALLDLEED